MSHTNQIFEKQPVEIQNLNGFDLSHINCGTAICGTLTPVLRKLIMPGSKFSLGLAMNVELPPLATNFFGRIDAVVEVFFCPCAVLYGGWRQFISNQVATMFPDSQDAVLDAGGYMLPYIDMSQEAVLTAYSSYEAANTGLSDYLGVRLSNYDTDGNGYALKLNLLPYLAYHRIWDVFYRNASVTKTIFAVNPNAGSSSDITLTAANATAGLAYNKKNVSLIWHSFYFSIPSSSSGSASSPWASSPAFVSVDQLTFPDTISVLSMRQRNWSRGYFTAGSVDPQMGNASTVSFTADLSTGDGEITIAALRAANSLQKWLEAMNYDPTYRGIMRNHFGVSPSDAELDEPSYIGRVVIPVYQKSVYQNQDSTTQSGGSTNAFTAAGDLGAKGASGSFSGEGKICQKYRVNSFGYLMGIFSLVPHAMYPFGIDKEMVANSISDFPFPELQSVGMDGIKYHEIYADYSITATHAPTDDFAYIGRYSSFKYIEDSVHGEVRQGRTLAPFVLQREFDAADVPEFGTEFLEIPVDALDQVFATSVDVSKFSCWYEIYWVFKMVMPLAAYCVPTLGDIKDTHTQYTTQGGSRL